MTPNDITDLHFSKRPVLWAISVKFQIKQNLEFVSEKYSEAKVKVHVFNYYYHFLLPGVVFQTVSLRPDISLMSLSESSSMLSPGWGNCM